jgi:hypothetical protein
VNDAEYETQLGTNLINAALHGKMDDVDMLLLGLTQHTGNRVVHGLLAGAWIDAILMQVGIEAGTQFELTDAKTGHAAGEDLPAEVAWASQAFAARAAGDQGAWTALLFALPAEDSKLRLYLRTLLLVLANTARAAHAQERAADNVRRNAPLN